MVGSDVVTAPKPAPDIFLYVLDAVGATPSEALVFEDAEKGVGSAVAAGIPVVVIRTPETRGIAFADADLIVESHAETVELVRTCLTG